MPQQIRRPFLLGYDASTAVLGSGGIPRYVSELLRHLLQEDGFPAMVLLNSLRGKAPFPAAPVVRRRLPGALLMRAWERGWEAFSWERLVRSDACTVVHAPANYIPPSRAPLVATIHDLAFLREPEDRSALGAAYFRRTFPRFLPRCARIVTPSEFVAQDVRAHFPVDPARVVAVPHGKGRRFHSEAPHLTEAQRGELGLPGRFVLAPTAPVPRKRWLWLPRAWQAADLSPQVQLAVLGLPPAAVPAAARLPGIVYLPFLRNDALLASLYRTADAALMTAREEGFGFPVVEAFSQGTPVVCGRHSSLPEASGGLACFAEEETPEAYGAALRRAVENPPSQAGRGALVAHAAQFTWSNAATRMKSIYREVSDEGA